MSNRITYFIITGVILGIIVMGVAFIYVLMGRESADTKADNILGNVKEISLIDVQKNNTEKSCWTIIGGNVYDATSLLNKYSADKNILLKACGGDGTKIYTIQKYNSQELSNQKINELNEQLLTNRVGIITPQ